MKIQLWSIGKAHDEYIKVAVELFTKRLTHYYPTEWKIIPTPKNANKLEPVQLKIKEGEAIIAALHKDDYLILLDEKGKNFTSETLAIFIQKKADENIKNVIFLIGGAYGVSDAVMEKAAVTWSLSTLVFPHQLVRLILAEQLYRACTIARNEKYHHP